MTFVSLAGQTFIQRARAAGALLLFLAGNTAAAEASDVNLFANPSFEISSPWTFTGVQDTTVAHSEAASIRKDGPTTASDPYNDVFITLKPSTQYTISAYIKTLNAVPDGAGTGVRLRYAELQDSLAVHDTATLTGTNDWTRVSRTFTTGPTYRNGRLDLYWTIASGSAWFDDVSICEGPGPCGRPTLVSITPGGASVNVATGAAFAVTFSEKVRPAEAAAAVRLVQTADALGQSLNQAVPLSLTPATTAAAYTFTPTQPLDFNAAYALSISTGVLDLEGVGLAEGTTALYRTVMNPAVANTLRGANGAFTLQIPVGALPGAAYIAVATGVATTTLAAANAKLPASTEGRFAPLSGSVVDLDLYSAAGATLTGDLPTPATLSIPYADADGDGWTDGAAVKASTLGIWFLDETNQLWVRLPTSSVDTSAKTVTAVVPHFTVFALIGQLDTDLSNAYAFPSPFRAKDGHRDITFTGLGQNSRVRIYTLAGELVREILSPANAGQAVWDVKTQEGNPVASGVYPYTITSGPTLKKGKIMILR